MFPTYEENMQNKTGHEYSVHTFNELEVTGYLDVIRPPTVLDKIQTLPPRRATPIFRFYDTQNYLFPPLRIVEDLVTHGKVRDISVFNEEVESGNMIKLKEPIPAIYQGMLWVDQNLSVHYGQQEQEERMLRYVAVEKLKQGYDALKKGDLEKVISCARWAFSANPQSLKSVALLTAGYIIQGSEVRLNDLKRITKVNPDQFALDDEVNILVKQYWHPKKFM